MLIFLIRHGLTAWNALRRFQGACDIPLSEDGSAQAACIAERCSGLNIERIYHSPLLRAGQTAQIIAQATGAPLIPCRDLREVCMGDFQGLTLEEARARYPEQSAAYFPVNAHTAPPGGESMLDVQRRAVAALVAIEREAQGCARIAIVSHGALLKALICDVTGMPLACFGRIDVSNCSLSVMESVQGTRRLITLNDLSHFGDPYQRMEAMRLVI